MKDSTLRLQDKNVVLVGPFGALTQALIRTMTEFGADVGYVSESPAGRYIDGVNEAREVHSHYGRGVHCNVALNDEKQIQEVLGQLVGSLGRMDILIDATPMAWTATTDVHAATESCLKLAEKMIPFFLAKQRGRIVYLLEDASLDVLRPDGAGVAAREVLSAMMDKLASQYRTSGISVNAISVGITDDFILRANPRTVSIKKSFEEVAKSHPGLKLVELHDVSQSVAYLCSVMSNGLTGQMLRLTHGYHMVETQAVTIESGFRPA